MRQHELSAAPGSTRSRGRSVVALLVAALSVFSFGALAQSPPYPPSMGPRTVVGNLTPNTAPGRAVQLAQLQAAILYGETPVSDASYALVAADRTIAYTAITAARTVTLLPAASYTPGTQLFFLDRSGNASSTKTISVTPAGADTINGANATTSIINAPYVIVALESDGVSKWVASAALSTTNAPFFALTQPSSGNFIGSGNPTTHQLVWSDTNPQFNADVMQFFSSDPSADAIVTVGGSATAGDLITLNFIYNSATVSVFYTVQSGDTPAKIANQLVCAIAANTTLFTLNGGTCNSTSGVVTAAANASYGGYASGAQIGFIVTLSNGGGFAFDYNSNVDMKMSYTVGGSATETITFPSGFFKGPQFTGGTSGGSANAQTVAATGFTRGTGTSFTFTAGFSNSGVTTINVQSTGIVTVKKQSANGLTDLAGGEIVSGTSYTAVDNGTNYVLNMNSAVVAGGSTASTQYQLPNALDNNPAKVDGRISGATPATGSVTSAWFASGATSDCPTSKCANFGEIANYAGNMVSGHLQSAWFIGANGGNGSFENGGGGVWIGQGVYSNYGGAPFVQDTGIVDMGPGTFNAGTCYYIAYTGVSTGDSLCRSGSNFAMQTSGDAIVLSSSAGVGINTTPTGTTFTSNLGAFVIGAQVPTANANGIGFTGGATPAITAENYGTTTFLPLVLSASSFAIEPSGSTSTGINVAANLLSPAADNATALGSGSFRWSTVVSPIFKGGTAAGSTATVQGTTNGAPSAAYVFVQPNGQSVEIGNSANPDALLTLNLNSVASPVAPTAGTMLHLVQANATNANIVFDTFDNGGSNNSLFFPRAAGGTAASPTAKAAGSAVFALAAQGYDGTSAYGTIGAIDILTLNQTSTTDHSGWLRFRTVASGSAAAPTQAMAVYRGVVVGSGATDPGLGALQASAGITSTGAAAGIGYATGAGCSISQGTNRTTGVTCTGMAGAITLFSAAGSATPQTFTVTDTSIGANDTVICTQKSGTDIYRCDASAITAGTSFKLSITDLTGTTSEAPVFNFTIIKGAAS